MFFIFLFISAHIANSQLISNESICIEKMKELENLTFIEQYQKIMPYYILSGDWIQKYGYYDRCLREDNGYSSVKVDLGLYKVGYGFCHSANCTAQDFNSEEGQKMIKELLNNSGLANFLQINLTTASLTFYNPKTFYPDLGWGTYITCAILIILFIMISIDPIQRFKYAYNSKHTPDVRDTLVQRTGSRTSPLGLREDLQSKQLYTPTTIIKDFSIILNYEKIMNLKTIDPNLAIFNGIRALSFLMVVYGHVCEMTAASTYVDEVNMNYKKWTIILLYDMMYAVDIFFWMGGFFLGYVMCDQRKVQSFQKNPFFSLIWSVVHRLMRIWPSYLICIAINSYIIPYLGSGPRWFQNEGATACPGGAWKNALFIDNFFEDWKICFGWGWYLTCDFQLFLTCLIPILIYCSINKVFSKIFIICMIIASLGWGYYVSYHYDFVIPAKNTYNLDHYYKYYVSTYARAPPYFLGLLIGILYREFKQQKNGKRTYLQQFKDYSKDVCSRLILQFFCYGIGFSLIFFFFFDWKKEFNSTQERWPKQFSYIYNATCRFLLTFGLTLIVLPNLVGVYDIFNKKFMNNTFFKFLAKISFTMYLVHLMFIVIITETFYETPAFYQIDMIAGCICTVILSIVFGMILSLLLELPFGNLDNRLMKIIVRPTKKVNTLLD